MCRRLFLLLVPLTAHLLHAADPAPLDLFLDKELVDTFAAIPVQESGRIKPLANIAENRLKNLRGLTSVYLTADGDSSGKPLVDPVTRNAVTTAKGRGVNLSGTEWLLVSWFRPDFAKTIPLFTVDNSVAVEELGLPTRGKRDQYSFEDLAPAREVLMTKMDQYRRIEEQTPVQRIIVQLAANFLDAEMLFSHFDFVRSPLGASADAAPAGIEKPIRLSKSLNLLAAEIRAAGAPMRVPWFRDFGRGALGAMMSGNPEKQLRIFPPADKKQEVWHGPGDIIFSVVNGENDASAEQLEWLRRYEDLYLALPDAAKFKAAAASLRGEIQAAAESRGEVGHIPLELQYLRTNYFNIARWVFVVGLVFVALTWVAPGSRFDLIMKVIAWILLLTATGSAVTGIVMRCLIMERPPIATLYETILFIGASCGVFGLLTELLTRKGLGLLIAAAGGAGYMLLAMQFNAGETSDSFQQLQAVLITNFWLATHVPMINLGYLACMVAALVSMAYIVYRLVGIQSRRLAWLRRLFPDGGIIDERRFLTRVAYGFVCVGLLLSLVGTVLGGIWANYSWGRFWGWDPKENGALMIVLMCLVILHARLGGYIREAGLHCCNLILGCIVIFSWFGVNQLGVGLHAYGFTDGIWPNIYAYWISQMVFLLAGIALAWSDRRTRKPEAIAPAPEKQPA